MLRRISGVMTADQTSGVFRVCKGGHFSHLVPRSRRGRPSLHGVEGITYPPPAMQPSARIYHTTDTVTDPTGFSRLSGDCSLLGIGNVGPSTVELHNWNAAESGSCRQRYVDTTSCIGLTKFVTRSCFKEPVIRESHIVFM